MDIGFIGRELVGVRLDIILINEQQYKKSPWRRSEIDDGINYKDL